MRPSILPGVNHRLGAQTARKAAMPAGNSSLGREKKLCIFPSEIGGSLAILCAQECRLASPIPEFLYVSVLFDRKACIA